MSEEKTEPESVNVIIDAKVKTMHVSFPRAMVADMGADVIRSENRGDPVEAARQTWHLVAPTLRECGWTDAKIVEVYRIPEEVLSGEADRRAGIKVAEYRLGWIEAEPSKLYSGEAGMIARFRAGAITIDEYSDVLTELRKRHIEEMPD